MTCSTCGAATTITDSTEHTGEGSFREQWECANGHTGTVSGDEAAPPAEWDWSGPVFEERGV